MNNQYLFNVKYYDGLYSGNNEGYINQINNQLLSYGLDKNDVPSFLPFRDLHCFKMKTVYPGLLIGTGNPHSSGDNSEEIKLGFILDYTTGLPYIPGSSIKGVIRAVFKENEKKGEKESEDHFNIRQAAYKNRLAYLRELIAELTGIPEIKDELTDDRLRKFEAETFGDATNGKGDLFFDAFPVRGGKGNKLFAFESITPHNTFKDPIPLRLLKIIPDVVFEFRFLIKNSEIIPELKVDIKEALFKMIISEFGIGAKTNVGFGMFEEFNELVDSENNNDNESIIARIIGYNDRKTTAILMTDDGRKAKLHFKKVPNAKHGKIDEILPKNKRVKIRYDGKDDDNYDQWSLIEILG